LQGALVRRIGERPLVVVGLSLQALGIAWFGLIATPTVAYANLVAPLLVAGTGVSMAMPAVQNSVLSSVAKVEVGKASGIFNMVRFLGGAFGIAVAVAVFAAAGNLGSAQAFSAGLAPAVGVAAALSLFGAIAGMFQSARLLPALDARRLAEEHDGRRCQLCPRQRAGEPDELSVDQP
jgi:MFS family permease